MKRTALLAAFALGLWALGTGLQAAPHFFDLSKAANMGPAESFDEAAPGIQDLKKKSGLEYLPSGPQTFRGIPFQVLNPTTNGGHSYVVLKGRRKPNFPDAVSLPADHQKAAYLYFLHTCRWGGTASNITAAEYDVVYDDGKVEVIPLHVGAELTNFWGADDTGASYLAWWYKYKNAEMGISLYGWKNPRPEEPIQSILFKSPGKMPVPILFAITASDTELSVSAQSPKPEKTFQTDTKNWIALEPSDASPEGTALDMSFLLDGPAGKHGALKAQGDKLVFEDGTEARFWGVTYGWEWPSFSQEKLSLMADQLASSGCNLVVLKGPSWKWPASPENLKACVDILKAKGIYSMVEDSGIYSSADMYSKLPPLNPPDDPAVLTHRLWNLSKELRNDFPESVTLPWKFQDQPMVMEPENSIPFNFVMGKSFGTPYGVEWCNGWPNEYLGETPFLMATFGGFEGWAACLWQGVETPALGLDASKGMTTSFPQLISIQWPVAALAYLRGDLKEGKIHILEKTDARPDRTMALKALAHQSGVGDLKTDRAGELKAKINEKTDSFVSDTGQISWQGNVGIVKIDSPRFQALIGFLGNRKFNNNSWEVETPNSFVSLSAISLTKSPLPASDHLLITGVTRMENTGMVYNQAKTKLLDAGKAPILVEPLKARIVLYRHQQSSNLKVRALDMGGQPLKTKVPMKWVKNSLVLSWVPGAFYLEVTK